MSHWNSSPLHNFEQFPTKLRSREAKIVSSLIDGEMIKPFELSAQAKRLLGSETGGEEHYPLWFHYEQSRNVRLWRAGYSLSDIPNLTFWVNPIALIQKTQSKHTLDNPFLTPGYFSDPDAEPSIRKSGAQYFQSLTLLFEKALPHLHALSVVKARCLEDSAERPKEQKENIIM